MANCAPAESADSSPKVARKSDRPSKASLVVTVEQKQDVLLTTRDDLKQNVDEVLFSLRVPNQLLYQWYRKVSNKMDYLPLLNASIVDAWVVAVGSDSEGLSQELYRRPGQCSCNCLFCVLVCFSFFISTCRKLASEVKKLKGSLRESLLKKSFLLSVYRGDTISP